MGIFESICMLLCGVGLFLTGMRLMSDGLSKSSNKGTKALFKKISDNPLVGYGLGAGATAIVQSSAATTVMSMGLVNAEIMTVPQASAFVLGARLGTSITGILVALSSIKITPVLMALALVGICLILFVKNDNVNSIGHILCGLGTLFAGMEMMKSSIMDNEQMSAFFRGIFASIDFPLLLILVGCVFTALIQSSSATTGIMIALLNAKTVEIGQAMFVLIGATIGTCVTALLASIGASTGAKRVSVFNVLTALFGATVLTAILWPICANTGVIAWLTGSNIQPAWQLSLFGVLYSFLASAICLPLIKPFGKFVSLLVKDKTSSKDGQLHCYFIDNRLLKNPAVAVMQAKKEVCNLAGLSKENLKRALNALLTSSDEEKVIIKNAEEEIDFITNRVSEFLVSIAGLDLTYRDELLVGSLHHVIDDIERIGDHAYDFYKMMNKMQENDIGFSEAALEELRTMVDDMFALYEVAYRAFANDDEKELPEVNVIEQRLDEEKKLLASHHVERLVSGNCTIETGTYFYTAISSIERIGDHLENVAYSIKSITGDTNPAHNKT